mgnify:CR=1 FL=1
MINMKKFLTVCAFATIFAFALSGQAKKPSLMVVPSDLWCNTNGYVTVEDVMGEQIPSPDYRKALVSDRYLIPVISKINGMMADRGFPLKNMETEIKSLNTISAEEAAITAKDGSSVKTSTLTQLRQRSRADIILQLTWTINETGPKRSVTYTLQGLDAYTNKEIATSTGTGDPSFTAEIPVLLEEAVVSHMDEFCERLQRHFDDLLTNGREVAMNVRVFDNDEGYDLESEFEGMELREIIDNWVYDNTVSHRFSLIDETEVSMKYTEVRIPIYDERGRSMAAANFGRSLVRYLKDTYSITAKVDNAGLGLVNLYLFNK